MVLLRRGIATFRILVMAAGQSPSQHTSLQVVRATSFDKVLLSCAALPFHGVSFNPLCHAYPTAPQSLPWMGKPKCVLAYNS